MRLTMKLTVAFLFVCCLAGLLWEETVRAGRAVSQPTFNPVRARAIISGPNGIQGEVLFFTRAMSRLSDASARSANRASDSR